MFMYHKKDTCTVWGLSWNNIELGLHEIIQPNPLESLAKDVQILQGDELLKSVQDISQMYTHVWTTKNYKEHESTIGREKDMPIM